MGTKALNTRIPGSSEHYLDAALYEHEYKRRRDDVNFYVALASGEVGPGSDVLELCCGSGRVTRALLRSGLRVRGIDASESMLKMARQSIGRLPHFCRDRAELTLADMRNFSLGKKFGIIIAAFNSLEHLYTLEDIEQAMSAIKEHLAPGGLFAFDVQMPDLSWLTKDPHRRWARTLFRHPTSHQKIAYSTNHDYDPIRQVAHVRLFYEPLEPGPLRETKIVALTQRKFFPLELRALLQQHGFVVERCYGDFSGDELDEDAESQVLLCRAISNPY